MNAAFEAPTESLGISCLPTDIHSRDTMEVSTITVLPVLWGDCLGMTQTEVRKSWCCLIVHVGATHGCPCPRISVWDVTGLSRPVTTKVRHLENAYERCGYVERWDDVDRRKFSKFFSKTSLLETLEKENVSDGVGIVEIERP